MKVKRIMSNTATSDLSKAASFTGTYWVLNCLWITVGFRRTAQMQR